MDRQTLKLKFGKVGPEAKTLPVASAVIKETGERITKRVRGQRIHMSFSLAHGSVVTIGQGLAMETFNLELL